MTATLAEPLNQKDIEYTDPSNPKRFFSILELDVLGKLLAARERVPIGQPTESCKHNLFFGFFIDGTRNNFKTSLKKADFTQTNVARLYSAFPGQSVPGVLPTETEWTYEPRRFSNYFRVYTPGVGTPFPDVGDSGEGLAALMGASMATYGERRIIWTLIQAINNLHRYFTKQALIAPDEALSLCKRISLGKFNLQSMGRAVPSIRGEDTKLSTSEEFEALLRRLHASIQYFMPDPVTGKPRNVDPGQVKEIFVSVFGFSRGAAEARVFINWLIALCKLDAKILKKPGMTLGGFNVKFDFLGLFDTVASVGLASLVKYLGGHDGWADAEVSMRIPSEISQCVHFVAAHEVRRCFPSDSVSVDNVVPTNCVEIVYPGVHSDVGGGYLPTEQGKGHDRKGVDMLSRLPLGHMYRLARLAGVPLRLELAGGRVTDYFLADQRTIDAFNEYVDQATVRSGTLTQVMREQRELYIQWRKARRRSSATALESTESYARASQEDKNDLAGANLEFEAEIGEFEAWRHKQGHASGQQSSAKSAGDSGTWRAPGFGNSRDQEWEEIAAYWDQAALSSEACAFFDDYVHDSRAWFKITGTEAGDVRQELEGWAEEMRRYDAGERSRAYQNGTGKDPLTEQQCKWVSYYLQTGQIPEMSTDGREPAMVGAGYLRYRKIFAGGDNVLISDAQPANDTSVASGESGSISGLAA